MNESQSGSAEVYYWREGQKEVDYIVKRGRSLSAIEVKSGTEDGILSGRDEFSRNQVLVSSPSPSLSTTD